VEAAAGTGNGHSLVILELRMICSVCIRLPFSFLDARFWTHFCNARLGYDMVVSYFFLHPGRPSIVLFWHRYSKHTPSPHALPSASLYSPSLCDTFFGSTVPKRFHPKLGILICKKAAVMDAVAAIRRMSTAGTILIGPSVGLRVVSPLNSRCPGTVR
jgi:hypothetical protein